MNSDVNISSEEVYDILCGCSVFDVNTRDYGQMTVLDEDSIMEDFIPQVLEYISGKIGDFSIKMD